jgi:hypothetical protein
MSRGKKHRKQKKKGWVGSTETVLRGRRESLPWFVWVEKLNFDFRGKTPLMEDIRLSEERHSEDDGD